MNQKKCNTERKIEIIKSLTELEAKLKGILMETVLRGLSLIGAPLELKKEALEPLKRQTESLQSEYESLKAEWKSIELLEELGIELSPN